MIETASESGQAVNEKHHYCLELFDEDGNLVGQKPLGPADFQRAIFAVNFDGFREGIFDRYAPDPDRTRIEPKFPVANGTISARTAGFRVEVLRPVGGVHALDFDLGYFSSRANALRAELMRTRHYAPDKKLVYQLAAYHDGEEPARKPSCVSLGPMAVQVPIQPGKQSDYGLSEPWDGPTASDLSVLVGRSLLQEAVDEARQTPDREVGGFVLGNLRRDSGSGKVFLVATCLVSGAGTAASTATSVTFTPDTFARAREMIALRARASEAEIIAGWYHSHPFRVCEACPIPMPTECVNKILFYSADDIHLMETTFDQPYMVGLLAAIESRLEDVLGHLPVRLFGWEGGQIRARGFDVIEA
jgi:proteasome lid subunit RPN8/RPN11